VHCDRLPPSSARVHARQRCQNSAARVLTRSCAQQCEAQSDAWNKFKINGVSMQQMNSKWWNSDFKQPSAGFSTESCSYKTASPHKCNPTC
jgi:hypothetical protein